MALICDLHFQLIGRCSLPLWPQFFCWEHLASMQLKNGAQGQFGHFHLNRRRKCSVWTAQPPTLITSTTKVVASTTPYASRTRSVQTTAHARNYGSVPRVLLSFCTTQWEENNLGLFGLRQLAQANMGRWSTYKRTTCSWCCDCECSKAVLLCV